MGIFKEENHQIIIDPEIKLIPEFKALIDRDKEKDKRRAMSELKFIYFHVDYRSPYMRFAKEDRLARVKRELQFAPDWVPDKGVQAAMAKYDELQQTPSITSLSAIRESLLTSAKVIDTVREHIEVKLKDFNRQGPGDDPGETTDAELITEMVTSLTSLLVLADKLPKAISTLEDLEEKMKKEQSNSRKIRGGGDVNAFED